ncbi:MAG: ribosomal RNA small subunit methyltransferase A [Alphaproteobacteria bacterium]|nr:MAG: ribosomal RNA small subunit methyltransferase A [Alphaproteobacteria bacterium]
MEKISNLLRKFDLLQNKGFSKKLGQNFILDKNILDKIVKLAGPIEGEHVLEIGSGVGSLSERILLQKPKTFTIIEKDPRCVEAVKSWLDVDIREADVLSVDLPSVILNVAKDLLTLSQDDGARIKVIANLPYNISTAILIKFCYIRHLIKDMTLMFQKEVAQRIVAKPSTKDFGKLSIIAQTCFDCKIAQVFPPSIFIPPPKVDSAVVVFTPKKNVTADLDKLSELTNLLFSRRRKVLRQSLSPELLKSCGIDPQSRVENLMVEDFLKLI